MGFFQILASWVRSFFNDLLYCGNGALAQAAHRALPAGQRFASFGTALHAGPGGDCDGDSLDHYLDRCGGAVSQFHPLITPIPRRNFNFQFWLVSCALIVAIPLVLYKTLLLWLEGPVSRYPEIDAAWKAGMAALGEKGLDVHQTPLVPGDRFGER